MDNNFYLLEGLETLGIIAGCTGRNFQGTDLVNEIVEVAKDISMDFDCLAYLKQVHEDDIHVVDKNENFCGQGDALITEQSRTLLVIRTADCFPVFLVDVQKKVVALVHAGWRSANQFILSKTINRMVDQLSCDVCSLMMFVGPGLQRESFEVQEDFLNNDNFIPYIDNNNGKYFFDLNQFLQDEAMSSGIDPENILDLAICTYQNNDQFYSYRRGDQDKRNYSFICIQ